MNLSLSFSMLFFLRVTFAPLFAPHRCQDGSGSGSGSVPLNQKFLLKWSVPLSLVEVLEFGSSEDAVGGGGRLLAPHSGEKVVINAKPSMKDTLCFFGINRAS